MTGGAGNAMGSGRPQCDHRLLQPLACGPRGDQALPVADRQIDRRQCTGRGDGSSNDRAC